MPAGFLEAVPGLRDELLVSLALLKLVSESLLWGTLTSPLVVRVGDLGEEAVARGGMVPPTSRNDFCPGGGPDGRRAAAAPATEALLLLPPLCPPAPLLPPDELALEGERSRRCDCDCDSEGCTCSGGRCWKLSIDWQLCCECVAQKCRRAGFDFL